MPLIYWRKKKLLLPTSTVPVEVDAILDPFRVGTIKSTIISSAQLLRAAKKGDPIYLVSLKAHADSTIDPAEVLPTDWGELLKAYVDDFPEEHPGLLPDRAVQLEINLEPDAKPASKPAYRLSPAEMDELKSQLAVLLEKGPIRPSTSPWAVRTQV
jgi:hypothetical protein